MQASDAKRFFENVGKQDGNGCWPWIGALDQAGYGHFRYKDKTQKAHRVIYEHFVGPIENEIHHRCENKSCVRPDHMADVTRAEHMGEHPLRGITRRNAQKTRCRRGHPFSEENTYWHNNKRECKICRRLKSQRYYYRQKAKRAVRENAKGL